MDKPEGFDDAFPSLIQDLKEADYPDDQSLGNEIEYLLSDQNRFREIYNTLPRSSSSILDIGTTPFTFFLNDQFPDTEASTVDYTEKMKQRSEQNGVDFTTHDLNTNTLPHDDETFDVVIFTEVLEHLRTHPQGLFEEFNRVLTDGGQLILTTPNFASLQRRLKLLIGKNPQEHLQPEHDHGFGHVRVYTLDECVSLVENAGMNVCQAEHHTSATLSERLRHGSETFDQLPSIVDRILSTGYHAMQLAIPSTRPLLFVVAEKTNQR